MYQLLTARAYSRHSTEYDTASAVRFGRSVCGAPSARCNRRAERTSVSQRLRTEGGSGRALRLSPS
eukprot:5035462-Prymnesium_polylepis.1